MNWTKENARRFLDDLILEIDSLKQLKRGSANHVRWQANALSFLEEVFGRDSRFYKTFASFTWGQAGQFLVQPRNPLDPMADVERVHQRAYVEQLDAVRGLFLAAQDELDRNGVEGVYRGKNTGPETSLLLKVLNLVEHKLRKSVHSKPQREKDVQDIVEILLTGADVPYSRESVSIEYATKTYRPDFTIDKADLALEVKCCGNTRKEKDLIAEINDDILAYRTRYGNVIFVVYDDAQIRDPQKFCTQFELEEHVIVRIIKH